MGDRQPGRWCEPTRAPAGCASQSSESPLPLSHQRPGAQRVEAFLQAFLRRCTPHMSQCAREDQLQRKAVVLEYFTRPRAKERRRRARGLSARQRRALRLFDIKPEQQRYLPAFLPAFLAGGASRSCHQGAAFLHQLWAHHLREHWV